ncbi:MAG: two-component system response regulator [Moritella sp.]|uniref:response regulator n=1 Tax=unclassified Moritella TaxID=2637987 RepID=UPI00015684AC|nr:MULTISPECIES: response regulator [unclassified Moritella]EDM67347.1 response regulator [Moritella sp. PE36]MBL1417017.1 response regulator [Moritella sp.]PHR87321.1 MAG: two-component system response regulator [Moritella sp.]
MTSTNAIKVLIIEDDVGIAEIHRRNLMKIDGLDVIGIATSKADAETLLEVLTPDLILLDVYLPDGNGLDILRDLRQQQHACDVILITADRDADTLQAAMRGGVVDYILKPVIFARLEESLDKYLRQKNQFGNLDDLDQHVVDSMISVSVKNPAASRLPKGIDSVTLDKVRGLFTEHDAITADNAGVLIGASRTTARRYLEHLISTGELVADLNYGTVGRPERTYSKQVR